MGYFKPKTSKTSAPMRRFSTEPETKNLKQEVLLQIPRCTVYLMDQGEALELARGEFKLVRISDDYVPLATIVKVTDDLQWPLTNDEPVVKLDSFHYLFSLPVKDGKPLSYGVTFELHGHGKTLASLDSFLKEHSCFSGAASIGDKHVDWEAYAPRIEDYNNVLAKAIAGGTGRDKLLREFSNAVTLILARFGSETCNLIFNLASAYLLGLLLGLVLLKKQVQKGGEIILNKPPAKTYGITASKGNKNMGANNNLKRVRNLSKMTEKMNKTMLDMVGVASGTVMGPLVNSKPGKALLSMVPGQVLLASLDAVNKVLDAAEVAEKQALSATSTAARRMMSERYGERAGEATEDVLATAGHCANAAWNIFKIRKAFTPSSTATSGLLNNAAKYNSTRKSY